MAIIRPCHPLGLRPECLGLVFPFFEFAETLPYPLYLRRELFTVSSSAANQGDRYLEVDGANRQAMVEPIL